MAKVARKALSPQVRTLARVIDDLAAIKDQEKAIKKKIEVLEKEVGDFLGDDAKKDGIYQGDLYTMVLKASAPLCLDNEKVLALLGATAYEGCKTPRPQVRKSFIKREH